jgi:putative FmdB family regulatory protein
MPIYEYRCNTCASEFEFLQLQRDAPDPKCPACKAEGVQRLISRLGLAGTTPLTGDALFDSDKLTFTQRQGLKGRVPLAAKQAYNNMRAARQAEGKELTHTHLSEEELAELDPDDPLRLEQGHYHDDDHVHIVDDEPEVPQTPQSPSASDVADHDH